MNSINERVAAEVTEVLRASGLEREVCIDLTLEKNMRPEFEAAVVEMAARTATHLLAVVGRPNDALTRRGLREGMQAERAPQDLEKVVIVCDESNNTSADGDAHRVRATVHMAHRVRGWGWTVLEVTVGPVEAEG